MMGICVWVCFITNYTQINDEGVNFLSEKGTESQRLGNSLQDTDSVSDTSCGLGHVTELSLALANPSEK